MSTHRDSLRTKPDVPQRSVDGVRRLGWLSLFGGTCALAGGTYLVTGEGVGCPFLALTGWLCPLCGASRMGAALLRGHPGAAWGSNPFLLVVGLLLATVWLWTAIRLAIGRSPRLPGPLSVIDRWSPTEVVLSLVVPALVFMVLRNAL